MFMKNTPTDGPHPSLCHSSGPESGCSLPRGCLRPSHSSLDPMPQTLGPRVVGWETPAPWRRWRSLPSPKGFSTQMEMVDNKVQWQLTLWASSALLRKYLHLKPLNFMAGESRPGEGGWRGKGECGPRGAEAGGWWEEQHRLLGVPVPWLQQFSSATSGSPTPVPEMLAWTLATGSQPQPVLAPNPCGAQMTFRGRLRPFQAPAAGWLPPIRPRQSLRPLSSPLSLPAAPSRILVKWPPGSCVKMVCGCLLPRLRVHPQMGSSGSTLTAPVLQP